MKEPFDIHQWLTIDLDEVRALVSQIEGDQARQLGAQLLQARRIFVVGQGRSGLVMRMFAMRLMHLGLAVSVVGDATAPAIGRGDLLVAGSGSGETPGALTAVGKAGATGARIAALTAAPASTLARLADLVLYLPGGSPKVKDGRPTRLPLGSTLEQSMLILLDSLIAALAQQMGQSDDQLLGRHANLE